MLLKSSVCSLIFCLLALPFTETRVLRPDYNSGFDSLFLAVLLGFYFLSFEALHCLLQRLKQKKEKEKETLLAGDFQKAVVLLYTQ